MKNNASTILLDKRIIELIKSSKESPRQTYNEILEKMARVFIALRKRNQYDEFLHSVQQPKMQELWDNDSDEEWKNA